YGEWDLDQDGIPANEEVYLYGTSPTHFDSDFDGLSDSNEVANARNPLNPDENGNGIVDGLEISFYGQYDPDDIDPRDGLSYGYKIANGLDPTKDCSVDSDGDGFPDWQEELAGTDPNNGQSTPEINQGESILTDITITLGHPLPAPVMLTIGPRKIMMRASGSWVLTLPQGVAHDISLSAAQPCHLKLGAELSSNRALLLDTSGVFTVAHPADDTRAPSMMSTTVPADAVYISGRKQCGIFARPQVKIKPPLVCFHASHPKTVEAVVTPELEGAYQWIWLNNGVVSAPAARVTNISWAGGGTADGLVISFHPTGAAWATFGSDTIYRCIHADDPESEDDDIEEHGDLWCSVHQQEYWRCAIDYPGQPECDHGSTTAQYPKDAGRPLAVNNDDDDGDGVLDLYDTDGVSGDDDFIKIYPFSPYTGGCCPCPSHNPSASINATRIYCSPRLKTWRDAAKTTQCTSVGRGEAVYVEGTQASTYIGGDKIIWSWSEDGETYARTNIYTIFSLRLCGDFDFNSTINNADYLKIGDLDSLGWTVPVSSNQVRKLQLRSDVRIPGHRILSLVGDAQIRIWATSFPSANDIPLLVTGQTVTNGIDCIDFGVYPSRMLFCEILSAGTATLSYSYVGTGEAEGYECGSTLTLTCADILSVDVIGAPNDGLVVLNGDDVTFEANVVPAGFALSTNQPIWSYRRLNSNNSWSTWTSFGSSAVGLSYTHTTEISGIFQVKASYDFGFNTTLERLYERKTDELYGLGKTGDPDAFGVTDTQIQITIRNTAKSFLGSTAYARNVTVPTQFGFPAYGVGSWKCNIFVAHRAVQAGAPVPAINGIPATYPPLANEWAGTEDTNPYVLGFQTEIEGWTLFQHPVYPQPGFIIAYPAAVGSGHVGIVDYDGYGIAAGRNNVNKESSDFLDGSSGLRKHE
ncbi:MAG: hypothetical protein PHY48_13105, partial [Candidatus Cloacimonetes bacterium]|nr:hypothetical protein [Candidatus Cloacimonadota bacterium]